MGTCFRRTHRSKHTESCLMSFLDRDSPAYRRLRCRRWQGLRRNCNLHKQWGCRRRHRRRQESLLFRHYRCLHYRDLRRRLGLHRLWECRRRRRLCRDNLGFRHYRCRRYWVSVAVQVFIGCGNAVSVVVFVDIQQYKADFFCDVVRFTVP